nr:hypothetical protein [Streptomyces lavendulae]
MLSRTQESEAEARRAYRFQHNPTGADTVAAATKAADTARERVAEYLLAARVEQLHERSAARRKGPRRGHSGCSASPRARWTARPPKR